MSASSPQTGTDGGDSQAISKVLEAEQAADLAVKQCERQAEQILRTARNQARHIDLRTDTRITRIHMRCEQRLAEQYRQLDGTAGGAQSAENATAAGEAVAVQEAVDRLAASLSGSGTVES